MANYSDIKASGAVVTSYANLAAFPSSGNSVGDLAFASDTGGLYVWDGTEWDRVASGADELPVFSTEPASSYDLATDGTATTISLAATDPEGFAISYDHDTTPSNQSQATIVNNNDGTFTVTPSTDSANEGSFSLRFKASDGVNISSKTSTMNLLFPVSVEYLMLGGGGAGATSDGSVAAGGGGGAGGYIAGTTSLSRATAYNITVGAAGARSTASGNQTGGSGGDTTFNGLTALGGGGGGRWGQVGRTGGSGGGGGGRNGTAGGAATQPSSASGGHGNNGGAAAPGSGSTVDSGGGGGGAGSFAGNQNAGNGTGGMPGLGRSNSITGTSVRYADGGGGGSETGNGGSYTGAGRGGGTTYAATTGSNYGSAGGGGGGPNRLGANGKVGAVFIRTLTTASATTGSPTVLTDGSYTIYRFTADGSITF